MRIAAAQVHPAWLDTPYSRPDVLHLQIDRRRLAAVEFEE